MDFKKFVAQLGDRSTDVLEDIREYLEGWGCDLKNRKPRTFEGEDGTSTMEIDLPSLIMELAKNQTVINIPEYQATLQRTERSNETLLSAANRHGPVRAPSCHKNFPNLGLLIQDANVIKDGEVGAPRCYNFCGIDGEFRDEDAWKTIEIFDANDKLADEITLTCTVNPGRWSSIYGRPYLAAKAAVLRLQDESKHYGAVVRRLRKKFPKDKVPYFSKKSGEVAEVEVLAFEMELEGFTLDGEYPDVDVTLEALEQTEKHMSAIRALIKRLNFPIRVSEAAFMKHGLKGADPVAWCNGEKATKVDFPNWCAWSDHWVTGYKESKRHKNAWARRPTYLGYHLRFRAWKQKTKLAVEEAARIEKRQQEQAA